MKAWVYNLDGEKSSEIKLPSIFDSRIREDIVLKYYESDKKYAPHSPSPYAGRKHSASGTISHRRHEWKGHYGKGISRVPRKAMWRRGEQFYWVGAEINSARGGRAVHAPKISYKPVKINIKEKIIAMNSGFASTAKSEYISKRYLRLNNVKISAPIILSSPINNLKMKQLLQVLRKTLGDKYEVALKQKNVRAGKGKMRGRIYKSSAGLLLIKSHSEKVSLKGIDVRSTNELSIADLYPLGRLTLYTEQALKELK
ncbi:50S ribosomal protein L4 [Candidatus Pacearchaeota archaeon]|nr:50S ribosomal protein L4 [Candidatus Pacearchaeota archaeon]